MAKLYREHILGEKPVEGLVRSTPSPRAKPRQASTEADLVAGDD